ncbi:hypothetical protein KEM56_005259 [Ascosphaera pollenicola]|nr:hypothetical protein KEM56_005259 [Ascosphaera pollenicola]
MLVPSRFDDGPDIPNRPSVHHHDHHALKSSAEAANFVSNLGLHLGPGSPAFSGQQGATRHVPGTLPRKPLTDPNPGPAKVGRPASIPTRIEPAMTGMSSAATHAPVMLNISTYDGDDDVFGPIKPCGPAAISSSSPSRSAASLPDKMDLDHDSNRTTLRPLIQTTGRPSTSLLDITESPTLLAEGATHPTSISAAVTADSGIGTGTGTGPGFGSDSGSAAKSGIGAGMACGFLSTSPPAIDEPSTLIFPTAATTSDEMTKSKETADETSKFSAHQHKHSNTPTLHLRTDFLSAPPQQRPPSNHNQLSPDNYYDVPSSSLRHSASTASLPRRAPSLRRTGLHSSAGGSLSPASVLSSPQLAALTDITPLPSPISGAGSPPWKGNGCPYGYAYGSYGSTFSLNGALGYELGSRPISRHASVDRRGSVDRKVSGSGYGGSNGSSLSLSRGSSVRSKKSFGSLVAATTSVSSSTGDDSKLRPTTPTFASERSFASGQIARRRNKTISSEVSITKPSPSSSLSTVSTSTNMPSQQSQIPQIHREEYLAVQRGVVPPTPPRSLKSDTGIDEVDEDKRIRGQHQLVSPTSPLAPSSPPKTPTGPVFVVRSVRDESRELKYRGIRQLGTGTFSRVWLGIAEQGMPVRSFSDRASTKPRDGELIALKVVELGPAGGADEQRVETSLRREIEILKEITHPSIVELKGIGYPAERTKQAVLALNHCAGGDLFEFASNERGKGGVLGPRVIRRMFAELVDATRYLHHNWIVHRDIKLENVLVNINAPELRAIHDIESYPYPLVTLSDLGLSRRIDKPPASPLLRTRCGSEDYAAPEIIMGQPYDGRATDAWALGVLLYALLESRLPFDPLPSAKGDRQKLRARTPHRIARLEYGWVRYGDDVEDWDAEKGKEVEGVHAIIDGLLKRVTKRISLDDVANSEWVKGGITVAGGIRRCDA